MSSKEGPRIRYKVLVYIQPSARLGARGAVYTHIYISGRTSFSEFR